MFQLSLTRGATPAPLRPSPLSTSGLRLSPDGRTMSYVGFAEAGGRVSIDVASVQVTDRPRIAVEGVSHRNSPRWSADGREIYYVSPDDWMMRRSASLLEVSSDGRFLLLVHLVRADERPIVVDTAAISSTRR